MENKLDFSTQLSDNEGGDFVHEGTKENGDPCPRGKIKQIVDDAGNITYVCKNCGRTWANKGRLGV